MDSQRLQFDFRGAAVNRRRARRPFWPPAIFAAGIAMFAIASIACALSGGVDRLIVARFAQGAGAAFVMPMAMAILGGAFAREERGRALGIFSGVTGFALIIGPAIGGFIRLDFGWRLMFWINLPIGLVAIALARARLRESFGPLAAVDIPGLVLVAGAALALLWGLLRGNIEGWTSPEVLAALVAGLLLTWLSWSRVAGARADGADATISAARVFGRHYRELTVLCGDVWRVVSAAAILADPLGLRTARHRLRLLPWTATLFLTAPIAGAVVNKAGERPLVVTGY